MEINKKTKITEPTLKSAKLYNEDNKYYLKLIYTFSNSEGVFEIEIPKVRLPIETLVEINNTSEGISYGDFHFYKRTDLRYNLKFERFTLPFFEDSNGNRFNIECIEKLKKEMTIEEIENELGYKIKIISKK